MSSTRLGGMGQVPVDDLLPGICENVTRDCYLAIEKLRDQHMRILACLEDIDRHMNLNHTLDVNSETYAKVQIVLESLRVS